MDIYRLLTDEEQARAEQVKNKRTLKEKIAYSWLPMSMKKCVECNVPVAFKKHCVFFPDLLFREAGFLVEIDGDSHRTAKRKCIDIYRDYVFQEQNFHTIRINNKDLEVDVVFWERLIEGLEPIYNLNNNPLLLIFIKDLRQLRNQTIRSWTQIEND